MFAEVRLATLCQRLATRRADAVSIDEMVDLLTGAGGEILGLPVGKLELGYQADFVVIDTSDIALQPTCALPSHLIQSMTARAIRDVYVAGLPVVKDHELVNLKSGEYNHQDKSTCSSALTDSIMTLFTFGIYLVIRIEWI